MFFLVENRIWQMLLFNWSFFEARRKTSGVCVQVCDVYRYSDMFMKCSVWRTTAAYRTHSATHIDRIASHRRSSLTFRCISSVMVCGSVLRAFHTPGTKNPCKMQYNKYTTTFCFLLFPLRFECYFSFFSRSFFMLSFGFLFVWWSVEKCGFQLECCVCCFESRTQ